MIQIRRKETIEGTSIAGIVKNGGYHYARVGIYKDGLIDAWELTDFSGIKERMEKQRLQLLTSIPNMSTLSIYNLGEYQIIDANWLQTKESYLELIESKIQQLNPELKNLYMISEKEKEVYESRRVVKSAKDVQSYYVQQDLFYVTEKGLSTPVFMKKDAKIYLVELTVFEEGLIQVFSPLFTINFTLDEVRNYFEKQLFFTEIESPLTVQLGELGEVSLVAAGYTVESAEKLIQIESMQETLVGKTRHKICREYYYHYLEEPSDYWKDKLREAYLNIPEHERAYLGDMDSKDSDYYRILFTNEKREV